MPRQKDLKRLVRARMTKTGEAYTAARAHLTKKRTTKIDYARLAGMSDVKVKDKTGCTWERWVRTLDDHGAENMSHREIAELVSTKYKVPDWWTQTVTVGYERIKGLRARGQRRDGSYETSKSRTFDVPVSQLFEAWADEKTRKRWLNGEKVRIRTATAPKSMRVDWKDGTIIAVGFTAKGKAKSSVAVQHTKLPDRETAEGLKKYWTERLDALRELLREEGGRN
jgi:uncharacterized protein YndB with AHSA1/START domain